MMIRTLQVVRYSKSGSVQKSSHIIVKQSHIICKGTHEDFSLFTIISEDLDFQVLSQQDIHLKNETVDCPEKQL